jgi:hypothetical protein
MVTETINGLDVRHMEDGELVQAQRVLSNEFHRRAANNGASTEATGSSAYGDALRKVEAIETAERTRVNVGLTDAAPGRPYRRGEITLENVTSVFNYHPWTNHQQDQGTQVRDALTAAAKVILRTVPDSPTRTRALNDLVDCRMKCNAAITFGGQF